MLYSAHDGLRRALIAGASLALTGCANLNTVERRTTLPGNENGGAIAVHLDAKQRVIVSHAMGIYCAEPNPDAISAASSGQGASASVAGKGSGAISLSAQESAASIGLRTQSIQLQREIFYRMCEAYYNGALSEVQLATLFGRSQNLTAVVLAIEQLTGAVAANQVVLTGASGATSLASLAADRESLALARKQESDAKAQVEKVSIESDEQNAALAVAEQKVKDAEAAIAAENAKDTPDAEEIERLNGVRAQRESERDTASAKADALMDAAEQAERAHADAVDHRERVEAALDSVTAGAASNATGSGSFSVIAPRRELSAAATKQIAQSVEKMVIKALEVDDTISTCLGVLAWSAQEEQLAEEARQQMERINTQNSEPPRRNFFSAARPNGSAQSAAALQGIVDNLNADPRVAARKTARDVCLEIITEHTRKVAAAKGR